MRPRSGWLRRLYYRIGIHAAPPGTLLFFLHRRMRALTRRRLNRYASGDIFARARFGGAPYYDIARIRRARQVDGLALIFFMGLGDYLFATPAIEALRLAFPGLPIYAYASSSHDAVNSPLVGPMLRANRYIDAVFSYRGRPGRRWTDYDFRDCLKDVPKNFVILPVIYDVDPLVFHRVTSVMETFNLPVRWPVPPPILEPARMSPAVAEILAEIRRCARGHAARGVVCCHFDTRSSNYVYPGRDEVVRGLIETGYAVVSLTELKAPHPGAITIDVARITPEDTIELLRALRAEIRNLYILSVNSVMWPISSALGIANLGLHLFLDMSVHQYLYPNIFVVTRHAYPRISPSRMFVAPEEGYEETPARNGPVLTNFAPRFVLDCFAGMAATLEANAAPPCLGQCARADPAAAEPAV